MTRLASGGAVMPAQAPAPGRDVILGLRQVERHYVQPMGLAGRIAALIARRGEPPAVQAVAGVDLDIRKGEVIGIVGESGCGKSTLGRMLAGILEPTSGRIFYQGQPVHALAGKARRDYELGVQMIFQDPFSSLNPRMRVVDIVGEAAVVHGLVPASGKDAYVAELMHRVGLDPSYRFRYPHQFSGGQRQRIGVARALAVKPAVIVCDEAVAALDVSIQAQVLNLFMELRRDLGLTYFFISHNLGVVSYLSDRVAIMYLGRIVELADTDTIFARAHHPYTRALLKELPTLQETSRRFEPIKGELPSPLAPPEGCPFHPRCPQAFDRCKRERPQLRGVGPVPAGTIPAPDTPMHLSACHLE